MKSAPTWLVAHRPSPDVHAGAGGARRGEGFNLGATADMTVHDIPGLGEGATNESITRALAVMSTVLVVLRVYRKGKDVIREKRIRHDAGYRLLRELDRMEQGRGR